MDEAICSLDWVLLCGVVISQVQTGIFKKLHLFGVQNFYSKLIFTLDPFFFLARYVVINTAMVCGEKVQFEGFRKHTFAQGVATSPVHDGESDGRRQAMRTCGESPIRTGRKHRGQTWRRRRRVNKVQ